MRAFACILRHIKRTSGRSYRLVAALRAHRVERRLGRLLTDRELGKLEDDYDPLAVRQTWLRSGGHLVKRHGRIELGGKLRGAR